MGNFLNEYALNSQILLPLAVAILISLPIFGYAYNKLMDSLRGKEHTSIFVAGGVFVTLAAGALISWKSALMFFALFTLDGIFMITGEFKRTEKRQKSVRRRRMPYVANSLLDETMMAITEARTYMGKSIKGGKVSLEDLLIIEHEINTAGLKIMEVKQIQINEK